MRRAFKKKVILMPDGRIIMTAVIIDIFIIYKIKKAFPLRKGFL